MGQPVAGLPPCCVYAPGRKKSSPALARRAIHRRPTAGVLFRDCRSAQLQSAPRPFPPLPWQTLAARRFRSPLNESGQIPEMNHVPEMNHERQLGSHAAQDQARAAAHLLDDRVPDLLAAAGLAPPTHSSVPQFPVPQFQPVREFPRAVAARNTESPSREARLALPEAEWFGVGILGVARSAPARRYTLLPGCGGSPESPQSGETAA